MVFSVQGSSRVRRSSFSEKSETATRFSMTSYVSMLIDVGNWTVSHAGPSRRVVRRAREAMSTRSQALRPSVAFLSWRGRRTPGTTVSRIPVFEDFHAGGSVEPELDDGGSPSPPPPDPTSCPRHTYRLDQSGLSYCFLQFSQKSPAAMGEPQLGSQRCTFTRR